MSLRARAMGWERGPGLCRAYGTCKSLRACSLSWRPAGLDAIRSVAFRRTPYRRRACRAVDVTSSTHSLRIIVTGLIAQHPVLGGVAWDYVQYPLGLHQLDHD